MTLETNTIATTTKKSPLQKEIDKRRTFAIISHPDAGKTTLTEKLLLFGGAIQTAGAVKSNKIKQGATSDFMEIERQRGISVATSVMGFEYRGIKINLLDTPGHQDFAEDTYRTLSAVDSVILVIDCAKGVETQTEKLMQVCRMRNTPVIVFINKLDRDGQNPFDILDEIEQKLDIRVRPVTWPIGMGKEFQGVYHLINNRIFFFKPNKQKLENEVTEINSLNDPMLDKLIDGHAGMLREEVELVEGVYDPFEKSSYRSGEVAPVFFGSALNNFGVKELLDTFIDIAPTPAPRTTDLRDIKPEENAFSGFVFKIHANLDPRHRDRIAFLRVCSGKFERNKNYLHVKQGKTFKFSNPTSFMANDKSVIEEAYPGDIIGLYDTGNFRIGDTLSEGEKIIFKGIPTFSPEIFKELVNTDPMKAKQLEKGIRQLTDEGVAQLFTQQPGNRRIIGTVGELQFEVIQFRLLHEYGASCRFDYMNFYKAVWITTDNAGQLQEFTEQKYRNMVTDKYGNPVFLAESEWLLKRAMENFPDLKFHFSWEVK
ncbi:MAG: peptide chain release factor 3 [Bacteroidetes bacterium]|nr:MAG: peptide chain release factor 3 [Bacteroidota bacterium]